MSLVLSTALLHVYPLVVAYVRAGRMSRNVNAQVLLLAILQEATCIRQFPHFAFRNVLERPSRASGARG